MKRRIISIILAVLILTSTCLVSASAGEYRDLYVGSVWVTSENASDVFGDGTVSFDEETSTLTLNNANIKYENDTPVSSAIGCEGYDLKIKLIGKNTITSNGCGDSYIEGISVYDGTLEIFGSGENSSLTVEVSNATEAVWGVAVFPDETSEKAYVKITDTEVNVLCDKSGGSIWAVQTEGPVTVSNSDFSVVAGGNYTDYCTALCTDDHYCIDEETGENVSVTLGDLNIIDNSKVFIEIADNYNENYGTTGIWSSNLNVYNSELSVDLGVADSSDGMIICGDATFSNSDVSVTTADGSSSTQGISVASIWVEDTKTEEGYGHGGNFYINDSSDVSVNVGDAANTSRGIYISDAYGSLQVSDSKVTVESGAVTEDWAVTEAIYLFDRSYLYVHSGKLSVSVPVIPELYEAEAVAVNGWVYVADGVKVTGTKDPFENGVYELVQADNSVPIVITSEEEKSMGDSNMDGKISVLDVTMIQRYAASLQTIDDEALVLADVDKDGKVTVFDATRIQRFIAQIITEF